MKSTATLVLLLISFSFSAVAQDAKAKAILDKLSAKTESFKSMSAEFDYRMYNKSDEIDETQSGSLISAGDQYHLKIAGQEIISDGKTVWTVIQDAEEVQVNNVPEDDEAEDYISPTKILTLWEKGFKFKYGEQTQLNGKKIDVINLYPEDAEDKSFHTIKLFVDDSNSQMEQIVIKGKDGTDYIYKIKSFKTNSIIDASTFKFAASDHPDFDVIDLR